ncbi:MAG TPA: 4Fe-4S dicluster domain-containing protein, partial [Chloroflexi bacterium]|nr:4Fe-4S dicluster domain-containing protein [Chloroflexota bacterium]
LDVVASEIVGLEQERNPVLAAAKRRGLYPHRLDHVRVVGAALDDLRIANFEIPATFLQGAGFARLNWLMPFFRRAASLRPHVMTERCIACGACREACPVGAIEILDGTQARIEHRDCIRCYCCHEMCPQDAIRLRRSLLYRLLNVPSQ